MAEEKVAAPAPTDSAPVAEPTPAPPPEAEKPKPRGPFKGKGNWVPPPKKPTGRPRGRPPKNPPAAAEPAKAPDEKKRVWPYVVGTLLVLALARIAGALLKGNGNDA